MGFHGIRFMIHTMVSRIRRLRSGGLYPAPPVSRSVTGWVRHSHVGETNVARSGVIPGILVFLLVLGLAGCRRGVLAPDLGGIYNRSAQYHDAYRNPVIVIPGILGSRLVEPETGRVVWGAFGGRGVNPHDPEGARLTALPMEYQKPLRELVDDVAADGVLDSLEISLLGLPLQLKAYAHILASLGAGGYRDESLGISGAIDYGDEHFTCFQFAYDWRRDNIENAKRLKQFILEKRELVRREIKRRFGIDRDDVKFDIIAHSMGGLVTRWLLRYGDADLPEDGSLPEVTWEGAQYIDRTILVGTPNAGSVHAVIQLIEGIRFAPIFHKHEAAVLGTFPSIYQLFPRTRHGPLVDGADRSRRLDVFDPELWIERGWGLADPRQDQVLEQLLGPLDPATRRQIALDHLRKCLDRARRFAEALDREADPPPNVEYSLIAGDAVPTAAVAEAGGRARIAVIDTGPGDGTVLRTSALLDERVGGEWVYHVKSPIRWKQVMFLFSDHLGMTMDPAFTDNVLYTLLEDPR